MSYKNTFNGGAGEAAAAEQSARRLRETIPGAWPERKGIDPELYDDIPDEPRDPKIVTEMAPGALDVAGNVLAPLFQNFQAVAADQLHVSESPASAATMASSTQGATAEDLKADIGDQDKP